MGEYHAAKARRFYAAKMQDWKFGQTEDQTSVGEPGKEEAA